MAKKKILLTPKMQIAVEDDILYYRYRKNKEWTLFSHVGGVGNIDLSDKADKFSRNNIDYNLENVYSELKSSIESGLSGYDIFACDRAIQAFRIENNL